MMVDLKIYEGFSFGVYLKRYLDSKGITYVHCSTLLDMPYRTFLSKLSRDSFSYSEVLYLDSYFNDLIYLENFKIYLRMRRANE